MTTALDTTQCTAMCLHMARHLIAQKNMLTKADQAVGDGDHGIGMARGFERVVDMLEKKSYDSLHDLLNTIGMTIMSTTGGAAGAVFGTFFCGAAKSVKDRQTLDADALASILSSGLQAVQQRGKAKAGDKTMVDVLVPSAAAAQRMLSATLTDAVTAVSEAAHEGMENTRSMIATTGKSKTLGERSLGHADPGAISMWLILSAFAEYVQDLS
jgi:dihydroxyacetone kinase-like protein